MPRRGPPKDRPQTPPDSRYGDPLVGKLLGAVLRRGQKVTAEKIVYEAFEIARQKIQKPPVEVLQKAVENSRPLLEVKPRRVGGATYQVPVEVRPDRGVSLALRWIVGFARRRRGAPMAQRLASELLDAYRGEGSAVKQRDEVHKMAEANRAFAHYRW